MSQSGAFQMRICQAESSMSLFCRVYRTTKCDSHFVENACLLTNLPFETNIAASPLAIKSQGATAGLGRENAD